MNITDMVNADGYNGFVGSVAPSLTVTNGLESVEFSIMSSGKRFNITKYKNGKPCGWMAMVPTSLANDKLNSLLLSGYETNPA